jgi:hypothetical protein
MALERGLADDAGLDRELVEVTPKRIKLCKREAASVRRFAPPWP